MCCTVMASLREVAAVFVGVAVGVFVGVALVEGLALVGVIVGVFAPVGVALTMVRVGVAAVLDLSVRLGAGVRVMDLAIPEGLVVLPVGVAPGVVCSCVAVGVGVVGAGDGEPELGEGDGLDEEAGCCSGSQDSLLDVTAVLVAVLAAAVPAAAARLAPDAAVIKTPPVSSVTVAGRA
ncbi:MAG: hypothetical protein ACRDNS_08130 [Trebonia sp.]